MEDSSKLKLSFCFLQIFIFALAWSGSGTAPENFAPIFCSAFLAFAPVAFLKKAARPGAFQKSVFWCGNALILICLVQYLNPAVRLVVFERFSGFVALEHMEFLPSGVDAPFDRGNPLSGMLKIASMMLVIFTCLQLFKKEKYLIFSVKFFVANALAVGIVGMLQRTDILNLFYEGYFLTDAKYASFSSENSAGVFINLAIGACMALFFCTGNFFKKFGWISCAAICSVSIFFTRSNGAIIMCVFMWFMFAAGIMAIFFARFTDEVHAFVTASIISLVLGFAAVFTLLEGVSFSEGEGKNIRDSINGRREIYEISKELIYENCIWGIGADCFSYHINPKSVAFYKDKLPNKRADAFKSAHSYVLEFLGEFGVVGGFLFFWTAVSWFVSMFKRRKKLKKFNLMLSIAALVCFLQMCVDVVFLAPSVLLSLAMFAVAAMSFVSKGAKNEA